MRSFASLPLVLTCVLACLLSQSLAAEPAPAPLRVLMVTGGCCHDYENQKVILSQGLADRIRVTFTIAHEGTTREHQNAVYQNPDWAKGFDVVLHNECYGFVKDEAFIERIAKAHREGMPGVFLHCSMHSYRAAENADKWREVLGVTSTSHEKARQLKVVLVDDKHPVMQGFPKEWKTPTPDELYKIEKLWPNAHPLAKAYGEETKKEHPVVWVNEVNGSKQFATTLGHTNQVMQSPEYLDLVSRGLLWACGKLTDEGKPAAGYAAESKSATKSDKSR